MLGRGPSHQGRAFKQKEKKVQPPPKEPIVKAFLTLLLSPFFFSFLLLLKKKTRSLSHFNSSSQNTKARDGVSAVGGQTYGSTRLQCRRMVVTESGLHSTRSFVSIVQRTTGVSNKRKSDKQSLLAVSRSSEQLLFFVGKNTAQILHRGPLRRVRIPTLAHDKSNGRRDVFRYNRPDSIPHGIHNLNTVQVWIRR